MPEVQAVLFDAYGTLFDVYSIATLAEGLFPGHGSRLATAWRDRQIDYTRLRTLSGRYTDFWTITGDALDFCCEQFGLALDAAGRDRLMRQYERLAAHPENLASLRAIAAMGLPLGILTNGTPKMLDSAIAAAGMDGLFATKLSVESVRRFKTAPEAYQLGPEAFGLPSKAILFVSSNCWDACCATWFGYTTFWINRTGMPLERLGVSPHATGRTMEDVAAYLRAAPS